MIPLPEAFKNEITEMLGAEAPAFFAAMEAPPTLALRLNPLRAGAEAAARPYCGAAVPWEPTGRYLLSGAKPGASIAHAAGAFYLQEASAMLSAAALDPQPGERILDLCAAPGGKSTQLAGRMAGRGLLVANEIEPARARVLASNLERLGVRNAVVVNARPDALAARLPEYFDALLCDAPCSGEGMFRREPAARSAWQSGSPAGCARRQAEILDSASALLRPGGRLVYSTCTFNRAENERTIAAFLARHPEFTPEDFALDGLGGSEGGMLRIWPQRVSGDGHFCARLRKAGDRRMPDPSFPRPDRETASALARLKAEICALPDGLGARLLRLGDTIIAVPAACPDLMGLRVVSAGISLMRLGRSHIEPQHALAMALTPSLAHQHAALADDDAARYLLGEAIACDEAVRGWQLMCWQGMPLGWAKASGGCYKNHLPKGLRRNI